MQKDKYITLLKDRGHYSFVYGYKPLHPADVACVIKVTDETMKEAKTIEYKKLEEWIKDRMSHFICDIDKY